MTTNRRVVLALAAVTTLAPSVALAQEKKAPDVVAPAPPAVAGVELLSLPGEARGDAASSLKDLLDAIAARPDDPASVLGADLLGRYWDVVPGGRAKARAVLEKAAAAATNGWAHERYLGSVIDLQLADGERKGLLAETKSRGYVRRWLVVGPFGYASRSILDESFPPEIDLRSASIDLKTRYLTRKGEMSWAKVPFHPLSTGIDWTRALRSTSGCSYLFAHVNSTKDQDVVLAYEGASAKLFVNRALAGVVDRGRQRPDQRVRIAAHLRAGWNRLVVKTGEWTSSFSLRLALPDGSTAPGVTEEEGYAAHDVGADADAAGTVQDSWIVESLAAEKSPERRALYAYTLIQSGRGEEGYGILEDAGVQGPLAGKAWFQILRAEAAEQADHLPETTHRVKAREAYQKALELDPANVRARRALADYDLQDDKTKEGLSGLEEILDRCPNDVRTRLHLYSTLLEKKWERDAELELARLETDLKGTMSALSARSRWLETKGDRLSLQKVYEAELESDRRNLWVYERRRDLAIARGDKAAAREDLEAEIAASWDMEDGEADLRRAGLARTLDDRDGEVSYLARALEARPEDLELRERYARMLANRGSEDDRKKSIALLDDLLEVEPARVTAQHLRTALEGKVDDFWKEWEYDGASLVAGSPGEDKFPNAATVCLWDQTVTRIRRDGSATECVHQVFKILNEDGIEGMGKRPQAGDTMAVRVFTPTGDVLEPIRAGNAFEMPGLAPGSIVEHEFLMEHGAPELQYVNGPWYLKDPDLQQPFVHSRWIVIAPKDMPLEAIEKNLDACGCKKTVIERGNETVRIWETFNQERVEPEPLMPPKEEFLPWVKLYERRSLEELAGLYADQTLGRGYVTPSIQAKADELCAKLTGDSAKLDAIYKFVKDVVRQPQGGETAAQILAAKGGNATTLMAALLDAAKVPYKFAFAAASPDIDTQTDWEHPEPFQFGQPLLRVSPRDGAARWVNAQGPKYSPMSLLPSFLWGAPVFICEGASGIVDVLPRGSPSDEAIVTTMNVQLLEDGKAKARFNQEWRPVELYGTKEAVKNAPKEQIRTFAAQRANQIFTGAKVKSWKAPDLEDPNKPFSFEIELEAEKVVRPRGDGALTLTVLEPKNLKRAFGGRATRKFDLVLSAWGPPPMRAPIRDTTTIDLGPYAAPRLPPDVQQESEFGQYSLLYIRDGSTVRIERTLTFFPKRVTPSEYKTFLGFLDKVDAAERRPLVVEPRAAK
jgi:tetratricopeptide (TPR) repeat protein